MANTLETKTPEQLTAALQSYNSYMCEIPASFTVLDEYLHGLTANEFCGAFKALQEIVTDIYEYLRENPQAVGLVKTDKKTGELKVQTSQHISCVKKLLYVIGRFSTLKENTLTVYMENLMNAYMTYYPNISVELAETINEYDIEKQRKFFEAKHMRSVFACLEKFGFEIDGLDAEKIVVCYPENPPVMTVIKAFATPRVCRISFGFDFTKFNYRVFAHKTDAALPLEDLYSFQLLSNEHKKFLQALNQAMNAAGASYGECADGWYNGTLPCQYIYRNKVRVMQNIEGGLNPYVVGAAGKQRDKQKPKRIKYIETLPDEYQDIVAKCGFCRKGKDCDWRYIFSGKEKKHAKCVGGWWYFPPTKVAVPYIVEAYKI